MLQAKAVKGFVPIAQALGIEGLARCSLQQPDTGCAGIARQFGEQRQAAAVRRAAWVAGDGQACRWEAAELLQQPVA